MLLFAGVPFLLAAAMCTILMHRMRRSGKAKRGDDNKRGVIARWASKNKMALSFGAAFLLMLVIAAVAGLICIKLSATVQIYYIICGIAMGAVAGAVLAVLTPPKE